MDGLAVDGTDEREPGVDGLEIEVTDDILVLRLVDLLLKLMEEMEGRACEVFLLGLKEKLLSDCVPESLEDLVVGTDPVKGALLRDPELGRGDPGGVRSQS